MLTFVEPVGREPASKIGDRVIYAPIGKWRCDCGKVIVCRNRYVVNGKKKSCGCLRLAKGEEWHKGKRVERRTSHSSAIDNLADAIRELAEAIKMKGEKNDAVSGIAG